MTQAGLSPVVGIDWLGDASSCARRALNIAGALRAAPTIHAMENLNLKAVQIASGAAGIIALIFGLISRDSQNLDCGSIFFKGAASGGCEKLDKYPMDAGLLLVIILIAAAVCIYATVARSDTTN